MNIIQQFKDADGNNIYPLAYAQGGCKLDLLWTNPSPSSTFAAQTVSLDLSDYEMLYICFSSNSDLKYFNSILIPASYNNSLYAESANTYDGITMRRLLTISNSGVIFDVGQYCQNHSSSWVTSNGILIPYQIYGIKMSYIVPTTVHGLQYVEV